MNRCNFFNLQNLLNQREKKVFHICNYIVTHVSFIAFFSLLTLLSFLSKSEDLLLWETDKPLQIEDFRAIQNDTIKRGNQFLGAMSYIKIQFRTLQKGKNTVPEISIKNYFDRNESWILVKEDYVLQHEQIHFDISELYTRKLRKSVESLQQKKVSNLEIYKKKLNYWNQMSQQTNKAFDKENNDSYTLKNGTFILNKNPKQKEWKNKIENELNEMTEFK